MPFLERLLPWLFPSPGRVRRYGDPDVDALDTEQLAREIKLDEAARRLGEANLPAADAADLTGVEAAILRRVEKARQDFLAWSVDQLKALNQEIERRDITALANQAEQADLEFERRASALLAERDSLLTELAGAARGAGAEFERFRAAHRLSRPPVYPDGAGIFLRLSLLVLLIVAEAALNAVFFAKGLATGLVGGFVYAAAFALANVAFAFLFGRWLLPNLHHRHPGRKLLGLLALPAAAATALAVGLLIAHFRDALGADLADAPRAALESLRTTPLALREIQSWALLGVSLLFAVVALVDGHGLDDPYPGHGAADRRRREAREAYTEELEDLRTQLQTLKDETLAQLDRSLAEARGGVQALHLAIEQKTATAARFRNTWADLDHCREALLRRFRDLNRLYRTAPCPAYFSAPAAASDLQPPDFEVAGDRRKYAEQTARLHGLVARIEGLRAAIQSSFVRHRDGLQPLDAQFEPHRETP